MRDEILLKASEKLAEKALSENNEALFHQAFCAAAMISVEGRGNAACNYVSEQSTKPRPVVFQLEDLSCCKKS